MLEADVEKCIKDIKIKNNKGFDQIPQRILVEGCAPLLSPLSAFFLAKFTFKRNFLSNG
jgi:hypothetical protein